MPVASRRMPETAASAALDALGNTVRRQIVELLSNGPRAAGEIAKLFPISRPAVSKHLRLLEQAGIITHETVGNRNLYRLEQVGFDHARQWLDHFWTDALNRFALVAENTFETHDHE